MEATLLGRPHAFERGERIYLTTPLILARPTSGQVEEMAFASAVKSLAPNENIGWLSGRYVESGRPNLNGAMWLSDELALKSLTPMLMPVTVMHDPRTAVGTIADCKLVDETAARIDTILAVWRHRFPDIWEEAEANVERGQLMQSMECYAPSYSCSSCSQQYVKLPNGAERAAWCSHLRANDSSQAWRILADVCFTGTGLIFGSRGGVGAYSEAHLDHFQNEIAEYHDRAHIDSTYRPTDRSTQMALVQIEESELATLRQERNEARTQVETLSNEKRELTGKVEKAEADLKQATDEKAQADQKVKDLEESAQAATLKGKRLGALGVGFMAKLGDTSKTALNELAGTVSDEDWDKALKEREEYAGVKRDQAGEPGSTTAPSSATNGATSDASNGPSFSDEEVASFVNGGVGGQPKGNGGADGIAAVRTIAKSFAKKAAPAAAEKS